MKKNNWFCILITTTAFLSSCTRHTDEISRVAHYPYRVVQQTDVLRDIESMEKRVQGDHPQATDLGVLAGLYYAEGRVTGTTIWFDKAEQTANQSLKIQTDANSGAKLILAKVMATRHDFAQAIQIAMDVNKVDGKKTSALAIIATSSLATGDLNQAGSYADRFVDQSPGLESYGLRALVMEAQGRTEEAKNDFVHALDIEDLGEAQESAWVRSVFARFLMRLGDYKHAKLLLNEALRTVPHYHLALDIFGELSVRQKDYETAEKYYKDAFESSKQLAYLSHLSKLKLMEGQKVLAGEIQTQAELLIRGEMVKSGYGHRLDLASILLDRGNPNDIQEALTLAVDDTKTRRGSLALSVLARAQLAAGKSSDAMSTMRELLRSGTRDPDFYFQMSSVEAAVKNPRLEAFYLSEAKKIDPRNRLYSK